MLRYQDRRRLPQASVYADYGGKSDASAGQHGRQARRIGKANCLTSATDRKFKPIYLQQSGS
ncbi:hypothetical protein [Aeromonas jandaei]|uniref:hypothetical protein n=1 Tax=Aeromonas jandaei TaxID=650 RepID=UPI003986757E